MILGHIVTFGLDLTTMAVATKYIGSPILLNNLDLLMRDTFSRFICSLAAMKSLAIYNAMKETLPDIIYASFLLTLVSSG
jgi:hypothetical protein